MQTFELAPSCAFALPPKMSPCERIMIETASRLGSIFFLFFFVFRPSQPF